MYRCEALGLVLETRHHNKTRFSILLAFHRRVGRWLTYWMVRLSLAAALPMYISQFFELLMSFCVACCGNGRQKLESHSWEEQSLINRAHIIWAPSKEHTQQLMVRYVCMHTIPTETEHRLQKDCVPTCTLFTNSSECGLEKETYYTSPRAWH